ncbi:hypothetical protein [Staphylococcus aureus]|nr:hypothetical protein [Staphylococcus aureus]
MLGCVKWATGNYGHMLALFVIGGLMSLISNGTTVFTRPISKASCALY